MKVLLQYFVDREFGKIMEEEYECKLRGFLKMIFTVCSRVLSGKSSSIYNRIYEILFIYSYSEMC